MIEAELRQRIDREEFDFGRKCSRLDGEILSRHQCHIGDSHYSSSRISLRVRERIELFEIDVLDVGLLLELSRSGIFAGLMFVDESSWQCPHTLERVDIPLDEEDMELVVDDCEDDVIDGHQDVLLDHRSYG